jgi:hypothetical protein
MKSGSRWHFRGSRPEEDAAARDAARRSGMSVREWLSSVVRPTEAEDDERRWSGDAEDDRTERSMSRRGERESVRDRNGSPRADVSRRWRDEQPDDPRDTYPPDESGRAVDRDGERGPRRRDADEGERGLRRRDGDEWQVKARADEPGMRRRDRKRRFHKRAQEESRPPSFSNDDESRERYRNGRERPREREGGGEPEWVAHDRDREPQRRPSAPPADPSRGFDHNPRPDSPARELPKQWDADAEWRHATRAHAPSGDLVRESHHVGRDDAQRQQDDYAAQQEESRRLRDQQAWLERAQRQQEDYVAQQEQSRRLRDQQARLERQRRERELFERAAANAISEQRQQSLIDQAVAEISARQQTLDQERAIESAQASARESARSWDGAAGPAAAAAPMLREPPMAPKEPERMYAPWPEGWRPPAGEAAHDLPPERPRLPQETFSVAPEPSIDISGLQEQLREMTARIEALRPSSELEKAIVDLRSDLAEISRSFTEALPRRALEALETEVKSLGQRIDRSRQADPDSTALIGIERGLAEVREALRGLTPMEGLAGFDGALKAISSKVEAVSTRNDPAAVQQLEAAMDDLRAMIARVASDEALTKVAKDVRALSTKVDQVAGGPSNAPTLAALENRIDILASALNASTEAGHAVPRELEKLLSGLVEKLEWVQLTHTDRTALGHLEDRIAGLVRRLDASDARFGLLEGVERGLADLLVYVEQLRATNTASAAVSAAQPSAVAAPVERASTVARQTERSRPAERPQQNEQAGPLSAPSQQSNSRSPNRSRAFRCMKTCLMIRKPSPRVGRIALEAACPRNRASIRPPWRRWLTSPGRRLHP